MRTPLDVLTEKRGHLFPWAPVCLALGIGQYFALETEPDPNGWAILIAGFMALALLHWRLDEVWGPPLVAVLLLLAGIMLAGARAHLVSGPVLGFRYYGPVEGRIVQIDRAVSDKTRLTLDRVVLRDTAPLRTPARVRVTLHDDAPWLVLEPGQTVILTANLSPPAGPVEPGGFDFQRMAWFDGLGAVGYTRTPVLALAPPTSGLWVQRLRARISTAVLAAMPGEEGAFAAALMTGDRSGMSQATLRQLRDSNLAHLLAISGLHMGLLTGFIFGAFRYGLALIPPLALRFPVKKIAALLALAAATGYLALSGGNVATERAFVMVAVMLGAVLADRRALTLRAVAMAALVILALRPEALVGPGFQMSFAATTALVAVFGALRGAPVSRLPAWLRPVFAVVVSSAVAGAATAPIAAVHFNQISHYGLIANLLSVPLMGTLVIPAAVLAACLAPVGLAWIGLALMRLGLVWILGVAEWTAGLDGAISRVVTPPALVLPGFALAMLWLMLWQGRARWLGAVAAATALLFWTQAHRPDLLIAESGGLVGVLTERGRVFNKPKGDGFAAGNWLENDGDLSGQDEAFARGPRQAATGVSEFRIGDRTLRVVSGKGAADRAAQLCANGDWIVTRVKTQASGDCTLWSPRELRRTGTIAVYVETGGLRIETAKDRAGRRLWNTPVRRNRPKPASRTPDQ